MTAPTMADLVIDAYTTGYALEPDPWTFPLRDAAWIELSVFTETVDDPGHLQEVLDAGTLTAVRTALHRARLRLYAKHRQTVQEAARDALSGVNRRHLAAALLLLHGFPRAVRRDQALSTLRSAAYGLTGEPADWNNANSTAATAAGARGYAEAAASPTSGGPPQPADVGNHILTATAAVGTLAAGGWVDRQLAAQAWQLSGVDLSADPEQAVADNLDNLDGVGNQLEDDMHATMSGAFSDYFATGPGTGLGLVAWVTESDDKVCPDCDDNEANGPYPADGLPDMPAHPNCRCWFELA